LTETTCAIDFQTYFKDQSEENSGMLKSLPCEKLQNSQMYMSLNKTFSAKLTRKGQILTSNFIGTCSQRYCLGMLISVLKMKVHKIYLSTEVVIHKKCEKQ